DDLVTGVQTCALPIYSWLVRFVEHRIGDKRVVRLIHQWLAAGVLENGTWTPSETGTPQGGSISPLAANLYMHYVFDLWVQRWRRSEERRVGEGGACGG